MLNREPARPCVRSLPVRVHCIVPGRFPFQRRIVSDFRTPRCTPDTPVVERHMSYGTLMRNCRCLWPFGGGGTFVKGSRMLRPLESH